MIENKIVHKRKTLTGKIIKLSSEKTIKVNVETKYPHPKYEKIIKHHKNYMTHNSIILDLKVGDKVRIRECPPISKLKKWELIEKI